MLRSESLSKILDMIEDYIYGNESLLRNTADTHPCHCHNIEDLKNRISNRFSEQKRVCGRIQEIIDSSERERQRKVILIQAPTGFGKSWVALALAIKYGASILTSTVDLQEQYQDEFAFLPIVKGKRRYPCKQYHEQKTCEVGYCSGCKHDDQGYKVDLDPHQEAERNSYPMQEQKFIHSKHNKDTSKDELFPGTGIECYYWDARKIGEMAESAVYSYASYLSPLKSKPDNFPKRDVLICDEAHDYDREVAKIFEVTLDSKKTIELMDNLRGTTYDSDKQWDPKMAGGGLTFDAEGNQPAFMVDRDGTLMLTPNITHPEIFTAEEKIRHAWHFIRKLIETFKEKEENYEKCAKHSRDLLDKKHLKKHPELFCHKLDSQGNQHGFTIHGKCKGKQDPNTNHIQMVGHQKNCTAHRAYIRDNWYLDCKQHLGEVCDRDHRIYNHENFVLMSNYISGLILLDKALSEADAEVDETGEPKSSGLKGPEPEYAVISSAPPIKIGPIVTRWITTRLVNSHSTCSIFLSATINKDLFCRETHIPPRFVEEIRPFDGDTIIPVQHRRVILDKKRHRGYDGDVWYLNKNKLEKREIWLDGPSNPGLLGVIKEVLEKHSKERGILMLTNYRQMDRIREMVWETNELGALQYPDLLNRFTFDEQGAEFEETKKKHLDQHYHNDDVIATGNRYDPDAPSTVIGSGDVDYDRKLPICSEVDCEKDEKIDTKNSVIVTVKATTGINLPYDESRFQIILKAPYVPEVVPGLNLRAEIIKQRDKKRYWLKSAFKLVQYCGRSVRQIDDHAVTYILDGSASSMIRNQYDDLPKWFLDSYSEGWAGTTERMN